VDGIFPEIRYTHAKFMQRSILLFSLLIVLSMTRCAESTVEPTSVVNSLPTETPEIGVILETVAAPTVVFVQTTATPLPSPTVTPTPTPIVYKVQEGETLLEIAWSNGTTIEEITAVNPGLNPDFLSIGQEVVLPPPATPAAQVVAGTAVPVQVTVSQVQTYQTSVGGLWILGEVVNEGVQPVDQVQVNVALLDDMGEVLGSYVVWTAVSLIQAGQTAPFGVLVPQVPNNYSQPSASIAGGNSVVDFGSRATAVAVVESSLTVQSDRVTLAGLIQNNGELPVNQILLTAAFFNDENEITGFQQLALTQTLRMGETAVFTLNAAPPGSRSNHAAISVEAALVSRKQLTIKQARLGNS
jgi:LysM repeat protein